MQIQRSIWSRSGRPGRILVLSLVATLIGVCGAIAANQDGKTAFNDEASLRELLKIKLGFPTYLFVGKEPPRCDFENAQRAEELIGPYQVKTTFYGPDFDELKTSVPLGPIRAIVEIVPKNGRAFRRYYTLFALDKRPDAKWQFDPERPEEFAKLFHLPVVAVERQKDLLTRELRGKTYADIAKTPQVARLCAGLSIDHQKGPPHRYDDAYALDRQWWVTKIRKITGLDKAFPKPFVCPRPVEGTPATEVHAGTAAEAKVKPDAAKKIDALCRTWAADDDQAFALCVVRNGVIILHEAYGNRDGKPMTVDTKSWMASITKSMCASLMMELVDQGLVSLDDPVDKFVPAFRDIKVPSPITIRHMYTHTAGLHKWPSEWYHDAEPDIQERIALAYPFLQVGKEWGYNGQSYTLAGKVIEAVTGEAIPQCYHNHLLAPLGMNHTDVTGTHADCFSTALDMARFGQMLLNRGAYGKHRFFRPETFAQMLPQKLTKVLGPDAKRTFGIGLDGSTTSVGHGAASAATFSVNLEKNLVVVMARNRMGKNQEKYGGKVMQAIQDSLE